MGELRISSLSVGYEGKAVVSDINASAGEGELLALIGANGAGKSTLIKTIAGLLPPQKGSVTLGGTDLLSMRPADRSKRMSVLLTGPAGVEGMSCREVVAMGRYPYTGHFGLPGKKDEQAVMRAMEQTACTELSDRDFSRISDGQRQRVLIARALCQEPELLVLDEPTAFLDIRYQIELLALLQRLADSERLTIIFSIHSPSLAFCASHRILALKSGGCITLEKDGASGEWQDENGSRVSAWDLFDVGEIDFDRSINLSLYEYANRELRA